MPCQEYNQLMGQVESKRQAYAYVRLNEGRVHVSQERYGELVKEAYAGMVLAIKESGWHKFNCPICKRDSAELGKAIAE